MPRSYFTPSDPDAVHQRFERIKTRALRGAQSASLPRPARRTADVERHRRAWNSGISRRRRRT